MQGRPLVDQKLCTLLQLLPSRSWFTWLDLGLNFTPNLSPAKQITRACVIAKGNGVLGLITRALRGFLLPPVRVTLSLYRGVKGLQ